MPTYFNYIDTISQSKLETASSPQSATQILNDRAVNSVTEVGERIGPVGQHPGKLLLFLLLVAKKA